MSDTVYIIRWKWKDHPGTITTPVKCLLCEDQAAVIVYAPNGCTCSPNKIQPRCYHHLMRAYDTDEEFEIIEDFIIPNTPDTKDKVFSKVYDECVAGGDWERIWKEACGRNK